MDVSDQGGLLRVRDGGQPPVTPLELFFDLVFVFAVTQLSDRLLVHLTLGGTLETLFLLLAVWWAWIRMTWFTNWFALILSEHATHPWCREEALSELFVPDLPREHSQGLRRPGERLPRLPVLPAPLVKITHPALDLPEFLGHSDLLG